LTGNVGDVGLRDVFETGGLNEAASGVVFEVGEPAAARVFGVVGTETGLRPDNFGVDGFGEIDDAGKFGERAIGVNNVGAIGRMADALLDEFIAAPVAGEEIVGGGATFDENAETSLDEGFGDICGRPIDEKDGVGVLEEFGGVHGALLLFTVTPGRAKEKRG
jgi:hypothetical protein